MSSETPQNPLVEPTDVDYAAEVTDTEISAEMEQSYIDYAMSVIAGRSLPDVRDGLKPVQRRILYAMNEEGVTSRSSHRKSSSIIGDTMGNYHPHGDSSIYDTLVRMAQPFSMRHPLVDGQGNFGSIDGDPPAAMRYTEARMTALSSELLSNIDKNTVAFESNYDDRLEEPTVLPAGFPNLLVNGSSGIAVGMSTNIPPHNLGEIIDATTHLIDNPDAEAQDLMEHVKGPDFPTGAKIVGRDGIHKAYNTGRGKVRMRAEINVEHNPSGNDKIHIVGLPFQQNKSRLVERIADDVNEGEIEGITDLRDQSDRNGINIVIEVSQRARTDVVKNKLLDNHLEKTFGIINLALVDGQPQVLTLKQMLSEYVKHRKEVVTRRTQYDLDEAEHEAHILSGRLTALASIEDVVELIRNAETRDDARDDLTEEFDLDEEQANHIVRMQLGSLTSMEEEEIQQEYDDVQEEIERLTTILESESELFDVIKTELEEVKDKYANERRTQIVEDVGEVTHEDLIADEEIAIVLTDDDYVKRMNIDTFSTQNRGGKGVIGIDLKDGDSVNSVFHASAHDVLLFFTNHGKVHEIKAYNIPEFSRTARGTSAQNLFKLDDGEEIMSVVMADELEDDMQVAMLTESGYIKRTSVDNFTNIQTGGIIAINLDDGDKLVDATISTGNNDFMVSTKNGMTIRFDEQDVRSMGRNARGVGAIRLEDDDKVSGFVTVTDNENQTLLTITEYGYGKRTSVDEYRQQSRNGKGLIDIKTGGRNGLVKDIKNVSDGDEVLIMTTGGQIMRIAVEDVSVVSRNTKGVNVMTVEGNDKVASVASIPQSALESDEE